ncbi:hypothetical protein B0T25DRAFT_576327 [Lasiosphaeria hispida]|uniref:Uncharacterized protein n=1 Tax=Lasiosphaeria hispida TaxID=260671 RepID=A0AAJ0MKR1_9PEZI|nr:hypothetical protein B0T25DRAFT_576327 [Lasiosphaeria hispida]
MVNNTFKHVLKYKHPAAPFDLVLKGNDVKTKLRLPQGLDARGSANLITTVMAGHIKAHEAFYKAERRMKTCLGLAGLGIAGLGLTCWVLGDRERMQSIRATFGMPMQREERDLA